MQISLTPKSSLSSPRRRPSSPSRPVVAAVVARASPISAQSVNEDSTDSFTATTSGCVLGPDLQPRPGCPGRRDDRPGHRRLHLDPD